MALPHSLAPLRNRRFAALWSGAFASNVGTWMETVAVGILVTTATGQAGWAGIVAAAGFLPNALVGPLGGALADRIPRRRLLLTTTTVQTLLAATLTTLAAVGATPPWAVTLIVFASGCAQALGLPSYQSLFPDLVAREDLGAAIALGSAQWNLGRVIGPLLAGVVIGVGGYEWAFAVNTLSFFAVIAALTPLKLPAPTPKEGESIIASIISGARFAVRESGIRAIMVNLGLIALLAAPFIALIPAVALRLFHNEDGGTAALVTAQGVGAVTMALTLGGLIKRFGHRRLVLGLLATMPVALMGYALAPSLVLGVIAIFFVGAIYLGCLSSFLTIAQLRAPAALRGRVTSALMLLLGMLYPLGSVLQGALADQIGLRATTAGAAVLLAAVLLAIRLRSPSFNRDLGDPEQPVDGPEHPHPEIEDPEIQDPETLIAPGA